MQKKFNNPKIELCHPGCLYLGSGRMLQTGGACWVNPKFATPPMEIAVAGHRGRNASCCVLSCCLGIPISIWLISHRFSSNSNVQFIGFVMEDLQKLGLNLYNNMELHPEKRQWL